MKKVSGVLKKKPDEGPCGPSKIVQNVPNPGCAVGGDQPPHLGTTAHSK
jgi:hypothetical protein